MEYLYSNNNYLKRSPCSGLLISKNQSFTITGIPNLKFTNPRNLERERERQVKRIRELVFWPKYEKTPVLFSALLIFVGCSGLSIREWNISIWFYSGVPFRNYYYIYIYILFVSFIICSKFFFFWLVKQSLPKFLKL